jgi:hypothetical protein
MNAWFWVVLAIAVLSTAGLLTLIGFVVHFLLHIMDGFW